MHAGVATTEYIIILLAIAVILICDGQLGGTVKALWTGTLDGNSTTSRRSRAKPQRVDGMYDGPECPYVYNASTGAGMIRPTASSSASRMPRPPAS